MQWDFIKLIFFILGIILVTFFVAQRPETSIGRRILKAFAFSPRQLWQHTLVALRMLISNKWLFLVPFLAFALNLIIHTVVISFDSLAQITPETIEHYKELYSNYSLIQFVQAVGSLTDIYMYRSYAGINSDLLLPFIAVALVFYKKAGAWLNKIAGDEIWPLVAGYFAVTIILHLISYPFQYMYNPEQSEEFANRIGVELFMNLRHFAYYPTVPLRIVINSFFEGGMIMAIYLYLRGKPVNMQVFLKNSAVYMKKLFWLNVIIYVVIRSGQPEWLRKISYIDSNGIPAILNLWPIYDYLGLFLMAAPFLIVGNNFSIANAIKSSVKLTLKNIGRFLPVFILGGLSLSLLPLILEFLFGPLIPYSSTLRIAMLSEIAINTFLSLIIAIVFCQTLIRVMED